MEDSLKFAYGTLALLASGKPACILASGVALAVLVYATRKRLQP